MNTQGLSRSFGHQDFNLERVQAPQYAAGCPVKGCMTRLVDVPFRKETKPMCPEHGIRLHSNTYVYCNPKGALGDARLRNFIFKPELAASLVLDDKDKAETHRLGHETSEDALTWNVFVGLAEAGALARTAQWLIGKPVRSEPALYLWGKRVDLVGSHSGERFGPLDQVRCKLEKGIQRFLTEPDIMLVVPGGPLICIEAKFTSGNPLAYEAPSRDGEKPVSRAGLSDRYLRKASATTNLAIYEQGIGPQLHSQLFRNLIFASEMASEAEGGGDWHVVNLVSRKQWLGMSDNGRYSFADPEQAVRAYLTDPSRFTFRTWENLYKEIIRPDAILSRLGKYLESKSAHYRPAFDLDH